MATVPSIAAAGTTSYFPTPPPSTSDSAAPCHLSAHGSDALAACVSASTLCRNINRQAQHLFQEDALTITPEAIESVKAALASSYTKHKTGTNKKAVPRKAAWQTWEDPTLAEWPENDYRLFCGDLGNEVNDDVLSKAFLRFPSFNMARVVRDKRTGKTKGYGFVSFSNPTDLSASMKEMNGKYVGNRPIKLRKSTWKERIDYEALERQKNQSQRKTKPPKRSILHK